MYLFIHCLLLTPAWQGTLIWFSSWVSSLPPELCPGTCGLGRLMFPDVYKHGLSVCSVASLARCWIQCTEHGYEGHWLLTQMLNQSQFPNFSKTGWRTSLNISPEYCKWWGNLISVSSLAPLRAVCVQQVMGVWLQLDYQRLENQTGQTFKHNLFNSLFHFSRSFIPSVCLLSKVDPCSGGL